MAKAKENRNVIILECTECRKSGLPGVSRYTSEKNKKNTTDRLQVKKYCKIEKKHTLHKETR